MSFQKILAISGKPGLYELKVQTRSGFVAEALLDGKKITVGLRSNVSLLSEIAVFTYNEEVKLIDIFKSIATKENGEATISHKETDDKLKAISVKFYQNMTKTVYTLRILKKYSIGIIFYNQKAM